MPSYDGWLGNRNYSINAERRAVRAWARIQDRPTSITVYRGSTAQTAQTVRIEYDSGAGQEIREAGQASIQKLIVFGVQDHPEEDDTDLQKDDRFTLADGNYRVVSVIYVPGEIQAKAERIT